MSENAGQSGAGDPRPFTQVVMDLRRGAAQHELSEGLAEVVAAVMAHNKPGKVVLTLTVKPAEDNTMVSISDDVKVTPPKPTKGQSLFYAEENGSVTRTNPRQGELPLGVAPLSREAVNQ
jgi:hypothetical protein